MEAKAGVTLAARTTRGSSLTSAGNIMAQWASRLLEVAHDIDAGLGSLREEGCQRIKVVASQTIAEHLMPHWLLSLRAANSQQTGSVPEVKLTATNSEHAIASVRGGAADLGFVEKPGSPRGIRQLCGGTRRTCGRGATEPQVGAEFTSGERPRAGANAAGYSRTPSRHSQFTGCGAPSEFGRRRATGTTGARAADGGGDARRRPRWRGARSHEPARGGRRLGRGPAERDHRLPLGLTARASSNLGGRPRPTPRRDKKLP